MDWLQTARDIFTKDIFASETTGIVIEEAEPGRAVCSLSIDRRHCNSYNKVMGGAIFTLADFAFAIASNLGKNHTVSQSSNISFLSSPVGDKLIATATVNREGRRSCFYTIEVVDNTGRKVAFVTTGGMTLETK